MIAPHEIVAVGVAGVAVPLFLPNTADALARLERNLRDQKTDRVSLVLANGQTVHARRSDGWRTHHGRKMPEGLGAEEPIFVRMIQHGGHTTDTDRIPIRAGQWRWTHGTNSPGRITHWRRANP